MVAPAVICTAVGALLVLSVVVLLVVTWCGGFGLAAGRCSAVVWSGGGWLVSSVGGCGVASCCGAAGAACRWCGGWLLCLLLVVGCGCGVFGCCLPACCPAGGCSAAGGRVLLSLGLWCAGGAVRWVLCLGRLSGLTIASGCGASVLSVLAVVVVVWSAACAVGWCCCCCGGAVGLSVFLFCCFMN